MSFRLYIPGPVEVSEETLQAMASPMIGHRSPEFVDLYQSIQPDLQKLFYTEDPVFISTSSAWGVMEGALRNVVQKAVLNCMSGAFSDKWFDVSKRCGKNARALSYEWGVAVKPEDIRRELESGDFDTITLIHNETSTGTMNPLEEIMAVLREFPDVISIVDCVSSFTVLPIEKDRLGIDVLLTGSQKALALPPGMALLSISERALERASKVPDRGYYFDFHEFKKNHDKGMTPSTPVISHIFALKQQLAVINQEGVEARYTRHRLLNSLVRDWVRDRGLSLFPEAGYESVSLSCVSNDGSLDIPSINNYLRENFNAQMDQGYGKIKGKTFRINNMGNETEASIREYLGFLDQAIEATKVTA
ncbi:MAG: alanine--glyoxylate aminotransferase family protein [Verrucomicrobia bacterium]|nr:alanine--glyoxylate aminotransferase family protein [Verrucomicrobiota bacterium]